MRSPLERVRCAVFGALALLGMLLFAVPAAANTPIFTLGASPSTTQAGGHPDIFTGWTVGSHAEDQPGGCDCSDAKNFIFNNPPGVIGDPHALPQCTQAEFATATCPVDSQIGVTAVNAQFVWLVPIFNLEPPPNDAGLIGFVVPLIHTPIFEIINPRTESDYGLKVSTLGIGLHHFTPTEEVYQRLWGVPADSSHDRLRFPYGKIACFASEKASDVINWAELGTKSCATEFRFEDPSYTGSVSSNSPAKPFLSNPTTCGEALSSSLEVDSYDGGTANANAPWPATTGCDLLTFNPSLFAQPTTTATDSPSGIAVNLSVPQQESPSVPSPSEIRAATVTLPEGFLINGGAADGKTACSNAEARFGTEEEAHCPEYSKVGSLTIETPVLPGPLPGYVYLGQPLPGNRYRIFLAANGFGVHVKLAGTISPDPRTGQLVISFQELPQTPLSDFNMHFFGSERGLLATPTQCGEYPVISTFTPWDSLLPRQTSVQYFILKSGPNGTECPAASRPFKPGFIAGVSDSTAGFHAPFTLDLTRNDGDQNFKTLSVTAPPGLLATLRGIPYCSDAALATSAAPGYSGLQEESHPSCPAASQVGTAVTGVGAGTHPLYVSGKVYLAGPYKGSPLSLAVITPAVSGPYDLGNVVVRAALHVDPNTAQITAIPDPLPQILEGIPLRFREIRVVLNRPGFTLNPTNCESLAVNANLTGDQGAQAALSYPFQAASCAGLPFSPHLSMALAGSTKHSGNPALTATVNNPAAGVYANTARAVVTLPHSEFLDNAHIRNPCTRVQFAEGKIPGERCPAGSVLGFARAETPLLDKPLEGPVYLRSSSHKLPDVVAALNGQIDIALDGHVESVNGRLRTSFETTPDAPFSKFTLSLDGGSKGLLVNSTSLCARTLRVTAQFVGQNGLTSNQSPVLQTPCGRSHKRHNHRHSSAKRGIRRVRR